MHVGIVVDRCLNLGKTTCVMFLYTSVGEGSIELLRFTLDAILLAVQLICAVPEFMHCK